MRFIRVEPLSVAVTAINAGFDLYLKADSSFDIELVGVTTVKSISKLT